MKITIRQQAWAGQLIFISKAKMIKKVSMIRAIKDYSWTKASPPSTKRAKMESRVQSLLKKIRVTLMHRRRTRLRRCTNRVITLIRPIIIWTTRWHRFAKQLSTKQVLTTGKLAYTSNRKWGFFKMSLRVEPCACSKFVAKTLRSFNSATRQISMSVWVRERPSNSRRDFFTESLAAFMKPSALSNFTSRMALTQAPSDRQLDSNYVAVLRFLKMRSLRVSGSDTAPFIPQFKTSPSILTKELRLSLMGKWTTEHGRNSL